MLVLGSGLMTLVMVGIIMLAAVIMASGNAAFLSFSTLAPVVAAKFGVPAVTMLLPMQLASSIGRTVSPITALIGCWPSTNRSIMETGTTMNVGVVHGGTGVNVVPDFVKAIVDLRFWSNAEAAVKEEGSSFNTCEYSSRRAVFLHPQPSSSSR